MSANVGNLDRLIRLLAGVLLAAMYFIGTVTGTAGMLLLVAGIVLIATAALRFCPIYRVLGLSTCPR